MAVPSGLAFYQALIDALPDGVLIADRRGAIVYANRQLAQLCGYSTEELLGITVEGLVPAALAPRHQRNRAAYSRAGRPVRPMGTHLQIRLATKEGREIPVDIALSPMSGDGELVVAAVREAGERVRAQERLAAIAQVADATLRGAEDGGVLELIAGQARRLVSAQLALVAEAQDGREELVVTAVDGESREPLLGERIPVRNSLKGAVMTSGEPWMTADAARERRAHLPLIIRAGFGPLMIVPLGAGEHTHGVLSIGRLTGGLPFGPQDLAVASAFASQAVVALEFGRARDELQRLAILGDRERIGRELHDGVIQSLFAVGMNLQAAAITVAPELRDRLERAVTDIDGAIRDLRNYIFGLRPGLLADRQLARVMDNLAERLEAESGLVVAVDVDPNAAALLTPRAGDVVQLLREALSNVARHAGAETCRITLRQEANEAVLVVEDDGHGFDPEPVAAGQGLDNMRARVAAIGGRLEVQTAPERGTALTFRLPL